MFLTGTGIYAEEEEEKREEMPAQEEAEPDGLETWKPKEILKELKRQ
jgi:hypothetical protein